LKKIKSQVKKFQNSTEPVIPRAPFVRVVREVGEEVRSIHESPLRWSKEGMNILHQYFDTFLSTMMVQANELTYHRKKKTLTIQDLKTVIILDKQYERMAPAYVQQLKAERQLGKAQEIEKAITGKVTLQLTE
jgi:histone H3/H4